jgi:hypothetical protein
VLRKIKIYKIGKFDNVFLTNEAHIGKEKFNLRKESKIGCSRTQMEFFKV